MIRHLLRLLDARKRINIDNDPVYSRYSFSVDVLHDHLLRTRSTGGLFARSVATPPWGLTLPASIPLSLHAVVRGEAWLWIDGAEDAVRLGPGDVGLVVGGVDHHIASAAEHVACLAHEDFWSRPDADETAPGATTFLCGAFRFTGDVGQGLIESMPPLLALSNSADESLAAILALIGREMKSSLQGQQAVLDRLLDVLLIHALRTAYEKGFAAPRWYAAASDPRLNAALHAIHSDPGHPWTVSELASLSRLSRPAFARNFKEALGRPPLDYLNDWRMTVARDHLSDPELTINEIAGRSGYTSTSAFSTAFRRHVGIAPGQWRERYARNESPAAR